MTLLEHVSLAPNTMGTTRISLLIQNPLIQWGGEDRHHPTLQLIDSGTMLELEFCSMDALVLLVSQLQALLRTGQDDTAGTLHETHSGVL